MVNIVAKQAKCSSKTFTITLAANEIFWRMEYFKRLCLHNIGISKPQRSIPMFMSSENVR